MGAITLRSATADDCAFFFALHKESLGPHVDPGLGLGKTMTNAHTLEPSLVLSHARVIVVDGADVGRLDVEDRGDELRQPDKPVPRPDPGARSTLPV